MIGAGLAGGRPSATAVTAPIVRPLLFRLARLWSSPTRHALGTTIGGVLAVEKLPIELSSSAISSTNVLLMNFLATRKAPGRLYKLCRRLSESPSYVSSSSKGSSSLAQSLSDPKNVRGLKERSGCCPSSSIAETMGGAEEGGVSVGSGASLIVPVSRST